MDSKSTAFRMAAPPNPGVTLEQRLAQRTPPTERPVMRHEWRDLLFLHWRFPAPVLQQALPPGLTVDTFDNDAWLGIVPFSMRNIRPRWSPSLPCVSNFLELNLRTYVHDERGVPGVWFFSLDANQRLGVWWGRTLFHLPYHAAKMRARRDRESGRVSFVAQRRGAPAALTCRYEYASAPGEQLAPPGTLEFFLIERYLLFAASPLGKLSAGHVAHAPYQISAVDLQHWDEHLIELSGLPLPARRPDHACHSRGVDVDVFPLRPLSPSN